jgi:Uma2 family endonuclease
MPIVPRVPPLDRAATYEDLLQLPDHLVAEIVGGELHATPRPSPRHARAATRISNRLGPAFDEGRGGPGGWVILFEPELHLGPEVLVPDLAGWHRSRMPRLPDTAYFAVAPDWVCEVVSPATAALDRAGKLAAYARQHVRLAWLIDPLARTLEVLRVEGGRWVILATHAGDEVVRAEPFADIDVDLHPLWAEPEEPDLR